MSLDDSPPAQSSTLIDALDLPSSITKLNKSSSALRVAQKTQVQQTARQAFTTTTTFTTTNASKPISIVTPRPANVSAREEDPTSPAAPHALMKVTEVTELNEVTEATSYQCALCQETFNEPSLFSAHLKEHLRKNVKGNASNFNTEEYFSEILRKQAKQRKPKCSLCGLLLSSHASLSRHMFTHFPDRKPCVCPDASCRRKFTQSSGMLILFLQIHPELDGRLFLL